MVRKSKGLVLRAAGFAGLLALAGCAGDAPRDTIYQWHLAADTQSHRHTANVLQRTADRGDLGYNAGNTNAPIVPQPKPDRWPAWYANTNAPVRDQVAERDQPGDEGLVRFQWPLAGRVIADFGAGASGERNDGINIAARMGTPIHAAESGTVTYAGNELRNYGNLILIKHSGGYVTAYAHASSLIVARGDQVARGQVIGYTGNSGDVSEPQLHFEIRKGLSPVNPRTLLFASS